MMFDEAYQAEKETQDRLAKIDQAQAELAEKAYEFEVPQWGISATVDGFGALLDLVIPPGTTARRDAPAMLGRVITDTILGARRRVALDNKDMIAGIMGGKNAGQQLIGTSPLDGLIAQYEEYEAAKEQEPPDVSFVDNTPPPQRPEPTPAPPPASPEPPRHEPAHASREAQSDDDFFEDLNEGGLYQ